VYVDEEELKAAFDFFDVNKKGPLLWRLPVDFGFKPRQRAQVC
jgi:hypothetical protein